MVLQKKNTLGKGVKYRSKQLQYDIRHISNFLKYPSEKLNATFIPMLHLYYYCTASSLYHHLWQHELNIFLKSFSKLCAVMTQ